MWLLVIFDACSAKNGISAREVERKYGVCPRTAWHMMHRLREAMKREPMAELLAGRVIADETYYGGTPKNRHGHDRSKHLPGNTEKTSILALISRETGEVRSRVVPNVRGETLREAIAQQVDMPSTHLHTDALRGYRLIAVEFASHEYVRHEDREYVRGDVTTNHAETYFSQLKRSLDGTHHHVSKEHLPRYLAEFDFRYSTCKQSDRERMERVVAQSHGRRLMYRQPASA